MNIYEAMQYAGQHTNIIRARKNLLYTFGSTRLPYVCLTDSPRATNEIVIRKGVVTADRPQIALPGEPFQFEGFDFPGLDEEENQAMQVLIARRIEVPPARYVNKSEDTTTETGTMTDAVERAVNRLDRSNDIRTAVITAPENVWNLSILLYVGSQVVRSAPSNVAEHFERVRLQG